MNTQKLKVPLKEDIKFHLDVSKTYRKNTLKILFLTGVSFLVILNISLFITFVCTLSRVKKLENEVDGLRETVDQMKNRDETLINAIVGFGDEDLYDDDQEVNMETDPDVLIGKPDESSYYFEYDNYDEHALNKTDIADEDIEKIPIILGDVMDATNFTKQGNDLSRKKRDIIAATNDGVLINSESYAERRARNNTRYKMHARHSFAATPVSSESYFARAATQLSPRKYNADDTAATSRITSPYIRNKVNYPTKPPPPVFTRKSRVMHTEDKSKAFRQVVKKSSLKSGDVVNSNEETTSDADFVIVRDDGFGHRRYRQRHLSLENLDEEHPRVGRIKLTSIHYNGDTSKYIVGQHSNFNGNGHLRHPQRTFVDWKISDWVKSTGLDSHFTMEDGILTVKESGIYFVYAQIYYLDEHDTTGFRVFKNRDLILQCTVTAHSTERRLKGNTCYTGGVEYFSENDSVSLADITDGRYSLFEPGKSFFGLIKLGDVKIK